MCIHHYMLIRHKGRNTTCYLELDMWLLRTSQSCECDVDLQPVNKRVLHVFIHLRGLLFDWLDPDHVIILSSFLRSCCLSVDSCCRTDVLFIVFCGWLGFMWAYPSCGCLLSFTLTQQPQTLFMASQTQSPFFVLNFGLHVWGGKKVLW